MKHHTERIPGLVAERHALFVPLLSCRLDFSGFSTNGAAHASPGQRPGVAYVWEPALKGRPNGWRAPSGLGITTILFLRALNRAGMNHRVKATDGGLGYAG
jgi:hypothetical protein